MVGFSLTHLHVSRRICDCMTTNKVGILRENAETINVSDAAETDNTGKPESRTDLARADFGETDWVHP